MRTGEEHKVRSDLAGGPVQPVPPVERDRSERSAGTVDSQELAIFTLSPGGKILTWNSAAESLFGYTEAEATSSACDLIFTDEDRAAGIPNVELKTALESGKAQDKRWHQRKDGSRFWAEGFVIALRNETGQPIGLTKILRDETSQKRSQDDLAFLADAGERLAASLDYANTLQTLAELIISRIADYCIVYLLDEDGRLHRVACSHADPSKRDLLEEFCRSPLDASTDMSVGRAIRDTESSLVSNVLVDERVLAMIPDANRRKTLASLSPRSCIVSPLTVGGSSIGAITLVRSHSGIHYSQEDLNLVNELARRAAHAVDHARLHDKAKRAQEALLNTRESPRKHGGRSQSRGCFGSHRVHQPR